MLAATILAVAYSAPTMAPRPVVNRAASPLMASKLIKTQFDAFGERQQQKAVKKPVKILTRVEELKVLSTLAEAGLLTGAEQAGVFSKLEKAGAFSFAEKLLPLVDNLKLLSTAEALIQLPAGGILGLAVILLAGEAGLIYVLPDDQAALVALQIGSGALVGVASVVLLAVASLFGLLQGKN
jgi:hypothetical protein